MHVSRRYWLVVGVVLGLGVFAPSASASLAVNTKVVNDTNYTVSLRASSGGESCWNDDDFSDDDNVAPNSSFTYYSSVRDNNNNCVSAPSSPNAHMYFALYFEQPSGSFSEPISTGQDNILTTGPDYGSLGNFELFFHNTSNQYVYVYNSPSNDEWFPASPTLSGATGDGMFCVSFDKSFYTYPYNLTMTIEPSQDCPATEAGTGNTASDRAAAAARSAPHHGPVAHAASDGGVFNLLPMLQGECELFELSTFCSNISEDSNWNLENITSDVSSFEATDPPPTTYAWGALDPPSLEQTNDTNEIGELDYTFNYTEGEQDSSATTNGMQVGNQVTFGTKSGPINDQVNATYNFSTTDTQESGTQSETSVSASIPTERNATTYLYGFQGTGVQEFDYTADLTFGDQTGNAEPLTTVAPGILGYSPAAGQPCIGPLVGGSSVAGSVMQTYAQAEADGYSADNPNYDAYEQSYLSGAAGFNTPSSECPGFPSGFPSGAGFDGSGTMDASVLGGTGVSDTSWYPDLGSIVTCAYDTTPTTDASNPDTPCSEPSSSSSSDARAAGAPRQVPGDVIRASDHPRRSRLVGAKRSVLMIGENRDHDTLITGPGAFNVIQGGSGGETLVAKGRTDVIYAGAGNDRITGGPGYDSIYGRGGSDTITAGTGRGEVRGGPGNDTLISGPHSRSGLFGDSGNDAFYIHGTRRIGVFGGPGNDTYHVYGRNATRSIIELPQQGTDTIITDHSLVVPPNIEVGKSSGPAVRLVGTRDTRELVGSRGSDTLIAGPGNERLIGGGGDDNLKLTDAGFDAASGGPGADHFILTGTPFTSWYQRTPRPFSTQRITDFRPEQGDRVILRARYFGSQLLSDKLTLEQQRSPAPTTHNPTIMFDPATKLLSFDPDGRGRRQAPRVLARLVDFRCESSSAHSTAAHRVRVLLGSHCLPANGITITK